MTFAVVQTGGKQYVVSEGDTILIEKLPGVAGDKISFDQVLLIDDGKKTVIGTPTVSGSKIEAEIIEQGRAKKVEVIKYKAKSRYYKRRGHRQPFTKISIKKIS